MLLRQLEKVFSQKTYRKKYILAPQTTTLSPDGPPNYQCLDSGPPNYNFLIFWPYQSIYAVNSKQNSENTPHIL
jgi:hypothetical protein